MVPWAHASLQPKRHFDRFSRVCSAGLTAVPNTRTDTETTECATCVAMDRISATHAMRPKTDGRSSTMGLCNERKVTGREWGVGVA